MARRKIHQGGPTVIKKYANRRLYNTATSSYITLDHLAELVQQDEEFVVIDAKTGDDITHTVLAQIILEKETNEKTMLPTSFLRQIISYYGKGMGAILPSYLQSSMETFVKNANQLTDDLEAGKKSPLKVIEGMTKQNINMFGDAVKTWAANHPVTALKKKVTKAKPAAQEAASDNADTDPDQLALLQSQLAMLQKQVDALSKKQSGPKKKAK